MKKTAVITLTVLLAAILAAGAVVYFWPHRLSDALAENDLLQVTCTTLGVRDGAAHDGTRTWENVAVTNAVRKLLEEHPYRRSLPFSGSGMTPRENLLILSVYGDGAPAYSVLLADSGEMSVGGVDCAMSGAEDFIRELVRLLETAEGTEERS